MIKPISKQMLKAQRILLRDQIIAKNIVISKVNDDISKLQVLKVTYVAEKNVIQGQIDDLTTDISE